MSRRFSVLLLVLGAVSIGGCDASDISEQQFTPSKGQLPAGSPEVELADASRTDQLPVKPDAETGADAKTIEWDALIPEDWQPETLMADYDVEGLSDDDPRAQEILDKLAALWKDAPIVPTLEGQRLRLPGFVVPLEMDQESIDQFLLVPYYGACIHVPPPPANQTVHVVVREGDRFAGQLFDVVWVTGTMRIEHLSSDLAEAGYRLEDAGVAPYEDF